MFGNILGKIYRIQDCHFFKSKNQAGDIYEISPEILVFLIVRNLRLQLPYILPYVYVGSDTI